MIKKFVSNVHTNSYNIYAVLNKKILYTTFKSIEKPRPEHTKKPCCNLGGFNSCTVKLFPACSLFLRQTRQFEVCRKKSPRSELLLVRA